METLGTVFLFMIVSMVALIHSALGSFFIVVLLFYDIII